MEELASRVKASLKAKGFKETKTTHFFYTFKVAGLTSSIKTWIKKDAKKLNKSALSHMSSDCHLKLNHFMDLIHCPMSESDYVNHLRRQGIIRDVA